MCSGANAQPFIEKESFNTILSVEKDKPRDAKRVNHSGLNRLKVEGFWSGLKGSRLPFKHLGCEIIESLSHGKRFKKRVELRVYRSRLILCNLLVSLCKELIHSELEKSLSSRSTLSSETVFFKKKPSYIFLNHRIRPKLTQTRSRPGAQARNQKSRPAKSNRTCKFESFRNHKKRYNL